MSSLKPVWGHDGTLRPTGKLSIKEATVGDNNNVVSVEVRLIDELGAIWDWNYTELRSNFKDLLTPPAKLQAWYTFDTNGSERPNGYIWQHRYSVKADSLVEAEAAVRLHLAECRTCVLEYVINPTHPFDQVVKRGWSSNSHSQLNVDGKVVAQESK